MENGSAEDGGDRADVQLTMTFEHRMLCAHVVIYEVIFI